MNREVASLKQAFHLARKQERIHRVPYFPMLREDNARQGFFERDEFERLVAVLPEPLADAARFAYFSGWRKGEILPLRWEAVDRAAKEMRLSTSKNGRGRVLPLDGSLWDVIERRWKAREFQLEESVRFLLSSSMFEASKSETSGRPGRQPVTAPKPPESCFTISGEPPFGT